MRRYHLFSVTRQGHTLGIHSRCDMFVRILETSISFDKLTFVSLMFFFGIPNQHHENRTIRRTWCGIHDVGEV